MLTEMLILAQRDGSGGEFIYVIAVLILSVVGALADRFKKRQEAQAEEEEAARAKPGQHPRDTAPQRPAGQERPTAPPTRRPAPPVVVIEPTDRARPTPPARPAADRQAPDRPERPAKRRPARPRPPAPGELGPQPVVVRRAQPATAAEVQAVQRRADQQFTPLGSTAVSRSISTSISQAHHASPAGVSTPVAGRLTRRELRRAVILSEIFARPLALRDPSSGLPGQV